MSLKVEQVEKLLLGAVNVLRKHLHDENKEHNSEKSWYTEREFEPETELNWNNLDNLEYTWGQYGQPIELHGRTIDLEEADTGGEGHAEDIYMVFKTTDIDGTEQYWRKDGYYASYDGSDWDGDFREVRPVERVVVFYE
jgi:hypothetical protein